MSLFSEAIKHVLDIEGGYVNDPSDSGGETNHGITEAVARKHGYTGPMRDLPKLVAIDIAKKEFWDVLSLDEVSAYDYPLALKIFEAGYHCGAGQAGQWFQRALNAANNAQRFWPDVVVDGRIGPKTLSALQAMYTRRGYEGMTILRRAVNCFLGAFYTTLVERREKDEKFWYGWMKQRVS